MVLLEREVMTTLPLFVIAILIILAIALIIVYIFLVQYIYKDAVKRDLNGELWIIILLLSPVIGIIVYFIVRKSSKS
ncbi:MAG: hypothetical protein EU529_10890, partial [Promethearchaeota archaeon]